eukprot:scaffold21797_cov112-Isochrysis_galbana.AAC.5
MSCPQRLGAEHICTGAAQAMPRIDELTCGLSTLNWAFGGASLCCTLDVSLSKPVIPAAGSECPKFALMLPRVKTASGARIDMIDASKLLSENACIVQCAPK